MTLQPTPLSTLKFEKHQIPAHNSTPNTSLQHNPLILYKSAFPTTSQTTPFRISTHLQTIGIVQPAWRYTMYPTSHFHSTTHEVLCVSHGKANLLFGGDDNPNSVPLQVQKGDVMVVPAGVAHRLVEDVDGGFEMVGSYPVGCDEWDMCYGKGKEGGEDREVIEKRIEALEWFPRGDPIYGAEGGPTQGNVGFLSR